MRPDASVRGKKRVKRAYGEFDILESLVSMVARKTAVVEYEHTEY